MVRAQHSRPGPQVGTERHPSHFLGDSVTIPWVFKLRESSLIREVWGVTGGPQVAMPSGLLYRSLFPDKVNILLQVVPLGWSLFFAPWTHHHGGGWSWSGAQQFQM